ncbi:YbdK family carboxylate-amine ligase [Herbiconiux sp. CPCC 205763]|uniref:Putative glutamate--cysteine ligase 2 n=1 Tax=Herbiconiux aconitum TaxID=2970913 RepID=A0ABT2GWS9_9MICO|nr:YbdK family carboxylate-amine ligase [Herbiconiux aconitum]MCS5719356.1 YbdK family carboxylate-amine ligase [Herbiconiux aconitum]
MLTTFGIEEETMLVDRASLAPVDGDAVFHAVRADPLSGPFVSREYLASQVEFSSPVYTSLQDASDGLARFRAAVAGGCSESGVLAWNGGVPFRTVGRRPRVTRSPRYEGISRGFGAVVDDHQISALHVHVGVPNRAEGVRVMNAVRPWLPVLLALGGNSPFWRGSDTGFASWRSILMSRWTTNGCPPSFDGPGDYDARLARLVGVGGTADAATVAWNLRLSETHPTIEFRVFDAQLESWQSVLLAAICRALVVTALDEPRPEIAIHPELLDAAAWHAARDGLSARLVHPVTGSLESAADVVAELLRRITPALQHLGDAASVDDRLQQLLREGTGAMMQRAAHAKAGIEGLRALTSTAAGS